jgi:hypothetical protein
MYALTKICLTSLLLVSSGFLFVMSYNIDPPSESPDSLASKAYNARYVPSVVFLFAAIFVISVFVEKIDTIQGMLEIKQGTAWRRIHAHQLCEWLTDEQLAALRELDVWRRNQYPISKSEVEKVLDEYDHRKGQIVSLRPASAHVQG